MAQHLTVLERAIDDGDADGVAVVRGYFHWTLVDNYEWASGYVPRFGLFGYDPVKRTRKMRRSGRVLARIVRRNTVPDPLVRRYPF